jgi:hypothetical protein
MGRPDLIPELTYTLEGVKPEIDEIIRYGGNVQHTLSADNGYTVSLELESYRRTLLRIWRRRTRETTQGLSRITATTKSAKKRQ